MVVFVVTAVAVFVVAAVVVVVFVVEVVEVVVDAACLKIKFTVNRQSELESEALIFSK